MKRVFSAALVIAACATFSLKVLAQSESRDDAIKKIEAIRAGVAALEKKILEPSDEDKAAYAEFLKQPDTGLMRLLPREKYDETYKKSCALTIRGGGSYYSFAFLSNEYGRGSDIGLEQNHLKVGFAGADFGMITKVENETFEELTLDSPSVFFLSRYNAPSEEPLARSEYRRFAEGASIDGVTYKAYWPVEVNATYVLRSVNFGDSDVLVAFRVARKDTDGSLIIPWKMLKKYPVPKLARNN
jgi:hypothetical protein